jgi:protein O-mannosyl-transferase
MADKFQLTDSNSKIVIIMILTILILAVYWPVQTYEFVNSDDPTYVTSNYRIQSGITLQSIQYTFTDLHTSNWHPLTMMSHLLDWSLFGNKSGGHHWTSVIIHIFNTILLFLLLNRLTGALWRSAFVAALFAIHPLNVESVAWISERKNVLSTFFLLLTMLFYARYAESPGWRRYLPVLICFALGLMSKPMLVTLPFVLLLLDYWPLKRTRINLQDEDPLLPFPVILKQSRKISFLIGEKVPLFVLSFISILVTLYAARDAQSMANFESLPLAERISNAVVSYALYIRKLFLPTDLAVFYPITVIPVWQFCLALLFLAVVTVLACRYFRKYPYFIVGWFWYLGTLVPVIGLVQVGCQSMADRYAYVPLIGIFIIIAWGMAEITVKGFLKTLVAAFAVIALMGLSVMTSFQIRYWKDTIVLFERDIHVAKQNALANLCLANEYLKKNKIDEAVTHYKASFMLDSKNDKTLVGLGMAFNMRGDKDKAIDILRQALKLKPQSIDAHHNLGFVLSQNGRIDEAIIEYQKAIALDNNIPLFHNNLGNAFIKKGRIEEAINEYKEMLRINPGHAGACNNIAMLLMGQGKNMEAIPYFQKAIRLEPEYANAHFYLAKILQQKGLKTEADYHYQEAIRINPEYKDSKKDMSGNKTNEISR